MPKPSYPLAEYLVHGLKWIIESHCNFRLFNKANCEKLSLLVFNKTQTSVSGNTLYRIFLHPNNTNKPYLHTLDILAQFIDFNDWTAFCHFYQELYDFQFISGIIPPDQSYKSLLRFSIYNKEYKSLYPFLEQFSDDLSITKKQLLGEEIFNILKENPGSNVPFFKKFSNLPIIREGFFEMMADPEFRIPQYEFGLQCYLQHLSPEKSPQELQGFIFANALVFRYYFFNGKQKKSIQYGNLLYQNHLYNESELAEVHIFPRVRYFAYYLLYRYPSIGFDTEYWEWFYPYLISLLDQSSLHERRIILHTCVETLGINPTLQETFLEEVMVRYPKNFEHFHHNYYAITPSEVLRLLDPNASTYFNGQRIFRPS